MIRVRRSVHAQHEQEVLRGGRDPGLLFLMTNRCTDEPQYANNVTIPLPVATQVTAAINRQWGTGTVRYAAVGVQPRWRMRCGRRSPRYTTRWEALVVVQCER